MTDPAEAFSDRLSAVRQSMAAFEARWRSWAGLQPVNLVCARHSFVRVRMELFSLEQSWQRKEFVMLYRACPQCKKTTNKKRK